jgi:hypothetical protein
LPDVVVIRKFYPKNKRIWKIKRMRVEQPEFVKKVKKKQLEENLD